MSQPPPKQGNHNFPHSSSVVAHGPACHSQDSVIGHFSLQGTLKNAVYLVKKLGRPLLFVLPNMSRAPEDINRLTGITHFESYT